MNTNVKKLVFSLVECYEIDEIENALLLPIVNPILRRAIGFPELMLDP